MKKYIAILLLFICPTITIAQQDYKDITPAYPVQSGDKIEVVEVFWYGCPHCYALEPVIEEWVSGQADDVEFRRIPGVLGDTWLPHAKAFYTAEKLELIDDIHPDLFDAIHKEKRRILDKSSIMDFFVEYGVTEEEFESIYESDDVYNSVKQAFIAGQSYKLTGVPALVVNGKYLLSSSISGSQQNMFDVADKLIERERLNKPSTE